VDRLYPAAGETGYRMTGQQAPPIELLLARLVDILESDRQRERDRSQRRIAELEAAVSDLQSQIEGLALVSARRAGEVADRVTGLERDPSLRVMGEALESRIEDLERATDRRGWEDTRQSADRG